MRCASPRPRAGGLAAATSALLLIGSCRGPERPGAGPASQPSPASASVASRSAPAPIADIAARPLALAPGTAAEAALAGGDAHLYSFDLAAGRYAELAVDQRGIDVVVTLLGPDGRRLVRVDSPNGAHGPEPIVVVTPATGRYRLEVRSPDSRAAAGRYAVRVAAVRPADGRDRERAIAERLFSQGEELRQRDDAASLRAAVDRERRALVLFDALGERGRRADVLYFLGSAHLSLADQPGALGYYEQALAAFRAQGREREAAGTANQLGQVLRLLGEPERALARYQEALAAARRLGEPWTEANALNNLGRLYEAQGESERALASYEQALARWRALGSRASEADTLYNQGDLYQEVGETERAVDLLGQALAIYEADGRRRNMARALTSLGDAHARAGRSRQATAALQRALALQRNLADRRGEGVTLADLGRLHSLLGEPAAARPLFAQAAAAFREVGDAAGEAFALAALAWADDELGRPRAAIATYERTLPRLAAIGDPEAEAFALLGLARGRRHLGELDAARIAEEAALARVEALRARPASPGLRARLLALNYEHYDFYVSLLMELDRRDPRAGYAARALAASEEARARSLVEMLAEAGAGLRRGVDPRLVAREAELGREVNAADRRRRDLVEQGAALPRVAAAEAELRRLLADYDRAQAEVRRASPRLAALSRPCPLTLRAIQTRVLDRDTLLLEYALGRERSHLWAVTADGLASFELPRREVIERAARRATALLAASDRTLERGEAELALAELSRLLLEPAAALLPGRRLLVVPDGALHYVPFAALPEPGDIAATGARGANGETLATPLVAAHEVVTAPSASLVAALRREAAGRRPPPATLAVVADPVFDAGDPRVPRVPRTSRARGPKAAGGAPAPSAAAGRAGGPDRLGRLPYSRAEAAALLALVPPDRRLAALGFDASRETVLGGALARYRLVHFATHGVLDEAHPELSGIALSALDRQGRPRDGFVRAHEIYRLSLPADLVVLSACRTALGREIRGEGIVGLTRGFMYAGARRVLVSLWEVEDEATAELMRRFYQRMLEGGRTPAAALREAQNELRRQPGRQAPYYWAGFVLQGDG